MKKKRHAIDVQYIQCGDNNNNNNNDRDDDDDDGGVVGREIPVLK